MRRRVRRRVPAGLAGAVGAACVLLAGCGIPATGVVEAGEPAVGVHRQAELYFLQRGQQDTLAVVSRRLSTGGGVEDSLQLLFKGLSPEESKVLGLMTRVPPVPMKVGYVGRDVTVHVGMPAGWLGPLGVDQIVCTAMAAGLADPDGPPDSVTVVADGEVEPGSSDEAARCARAVPPSPVAKPGAKSFDGSEG